MGSYAIEVKIFKRYILSQTIYMLETLKTLNKAKTKSFIILAVLRRSE